MLRSALKKVIKKLPQRRVKRKIQETNIKELNYKTKGVFPPLKWSFSQKPRGKNLHFLGKIR
jgi:hypothetical protein